MRFSVHVVLTANTGTSRNAQSLVLMIECQDFTALFTGDADSERREKLP
jgi:beta-lactamase superfamily II metal-dependent hydrolase